MRETKEMHPSWCDDHGVRLGNVKIKDLHDFKEHPFHVVEDTALFEVTKSIEDKGVLVPLIVRVNPYGEGYEIIAGHRRKAACKWAGLSEVPVMIVEMDDNEAVIAMVDSNLQREHIKPSEKSFAYKMKLEGMKQQGKRTDLTSCQVGKKSVENPTLSLAKVGCGYDGMVDCQKKLYKERAEKNRKCKTEEEMCEFVLWEEDYHKELERIKAKKKELLHQKRLGKQCIVESIVQSNYFRRQVLEEEKQIGNPYDVPVPQLAQEKCEDECEMENRLNEVESKTEEMEEVVVVAQTEMLTETERDKEVATHALIEENSAAEVFELSEMYKEIVKPSVVMNETEDTTIMTKQKYEALSDEEKMKWIEIDLEDVYGSMKKFQMRMEELGIRFDTIGEYTDEYMRLCDVAKKQSGYRKEYCHERCERRR